MFSLTRTQIINDDMSAFDDLRTRIGRGAAKKLNKVFWTKFLTTLHLYGRSWQLHHWQHHNAAD